MDAWAKLWPTPCVLLLLAAPMFGCEELPGENVEGIIQAPKPLLVPTTGKPACVSVLEFEVRHRNGQRTRSSYQWSAPVFAPSSSLQRPDGTRLNIVGTTDRLRLKQSTSVWKWVKSTQDKPPAALYGRGLDRELNTTQNPEIDNGPIYLEAREYFTECGAKLVLRGELEGSELRLVKTNELKSSNAFKFFGVVFGAFFLFLVLPIVVLIALVIRRAKKKAAQKAEG